MLVEEHDAEDWSVEGSAFTREAIDALADSL